MADYRTYEEIYQTIMKAIGDLQYSRSDEVKAVVNMVYLQEINQCDELYPLFWLLECDDTKKSRVRAAITGITVANPPVVTSTAHGLLSNDLVTIYEVGGMTELNNRTFRITRVDANSFSLQDLSNTNINGAAYTAFTSGGYAHHRGLLLTSCQKVYRVAWNGYDKSLSFIGPEQLEQESAWWDKSTSRPLKVMHRRVYTAAGAQYDYLLWFQAADAAYSLRLWYEKQCARLSATTDVPVLPYQFHDAIISGAITRLGENRVQVENAVIWPSLYKAHIEAIKAFNRAWWKEQKANERSGLFLA